MTDIPPPAAVTQAPFAEPPATPPPVAIDSGRRRADVDAKQAAVGRILDQMGCEAAVLMLPAHVAWFHRRAERPRPAGRH